jgi:hypothetical protein
MSIHIRQPFVSVRRQLAAPHVHHHIRVSLVKQLKKKSAVHRCQQQQQLNRLQQLPPPRPSLLSVCMIDNLYVTYMIVDGACPNGAIPYTYASNGSVLVCTYNRCPPGYSCLYSDRNRNYYCCVTPYSSKTTSRKR